MNEHGGSEIDLAKVFSKKVTRRDLLKGGAAAGALLGLGPLAAACGGGTASTTSSPSTSAANTPKRGGDLRVGILGGSAKDELDPGRIQVAEIGTNYLMFEGLVDMDREYKPQLSLAEEVTPNADATEWTVRLKPNILWHDGKPLTADDVVFTFQRIVNPKDPLDAASSLGIKSVNDIVKVDARTVKFSFQKPNVLFGGELLTSRAARIVPVGFNAKKPIGTGPFKLDSAIPGNQFVLSAFKDYHGGPPYLDKVTLIEFADATARLNALQGDTIDAMAFLPAANLSVVESATGLVPFKSKTGSLTAIQMDTIFKPFGDVRVRQALRLICDRPQILTQAYGNVAWPASDMLSPYDPGYPADLPQRQQDLAQAKSLLKQAGYDNNLSVDLLTSTVGGTGAIPIATVFAEQAKGAGVTVNVKTMDPSLYYGPNTYQHRPFSLTYFYTSNYLYQATRNVAPGAIYAETNYTNKRWNALLQEGLVTVDDAKRNEIVKEAQTIDYNEGTYIVNAYNIQLDALSNKVAGLLPDVFGVELGRYRFHDVYFK